MNPDLSLAIVGLLAKFLLRTTIAFGVCLILTRLVTAAKARFSLWAALLYGTTAYWLYLGTTLLPAQQPTGAAFPLSTPVTTAAWNVPESWGFLLGAVLGVAGLVYGVILGYGVIGYVNKLRHLRWVMSFATEPPAGMTAQLESLAKSLGMRPPRLLMLSGASSPATFGWLRPIILLPTHCSDQGPCDLGYVLMHELHHVRRRDSLWNALGMASRAVLCFHPAAWHALKAMRMDRELACDLAVVSQSPSHRGMYAESLLRYARLNLAQEPGSWGIDFAGSSEHLTIRVHSILREARQTSLGMFWLRAVSGLALVAMFAGVLPFLGIPLRYTARLTPQAPAMTSAANMLKTARTVRRRPGLQVAHAGVAAMSQTETLPLKTSGTETIEQTVQPAGPGPHLQHRPSGAASGNSGKPQSIGLIDDSDSGQAGKLGNKEQTLQQSATIAAAIWKRVGDLDRH